jgi:hypothetical protein
MLVVIVAAATENLTTMAQLAEAHGPSDSG